MSDAAARPLAQDVETLRRIPLFARLSTGRLKLIAYTGEVAHYEPGETIVRQGDPADAVHVIIAGEAEVWLASPDGASGRLWTLGRHSLLGETAVLCATRRGATVRAKDHVVVFKIAAGVFLELIRQSADVGVQVMTLLAQRLEQSTALLRQHEPH